VKTSPYTLTDSGFTGTGIANPIPVEMVRDDMTVVIDMLNIAYTAGVLRGIEMSKPVIEAAEEAMRRWKSAALTGMTELERKMANADAATDAKALDRLMDDAGIPENEADAADAAAVAREQDEQVRRTRESTYSAMKYGQGEE
jgi:hypothetical protein